MKQNCICLSISHPLIQNTLNISQGQKILIYFVHNGKDTKSNKIPSL